MYKLIALASLLILAGCGGGSAPAVPLSQSELDRKLHQFVNKCAEVGAARILNQGGDPNMRFKKNATLLHIAAGDNCPDVVNLLIRHQADVNAADVEGNTPLMSAAYGAPYRNVLGALIRGGADVNAANNNGWTPLMWAAQQGKYGFVQLLLENGADVSAVNANGDSALGIALDTRNAKIVKLLQSYGASR